MLGFDLETTPCTEPEATGGFSLQLQNIARPGFVRKAQKARASASHRRHVRRLSTQFTHVGLCDAILPMHASRRAFNQHGRLLRDRGMPMIVDKNTR